MLWRSSLCKHSTRWFFFKLKFHFTAVSQRYGVYLSDEITLLTENIRIYLRQYNLLFYGRVKQQISIRHMLKSTRKCLTYFTAFRFVPYFCIDAKFWLSMSNSSVLFLLFSKFVIVFLFSLKSAFFPAQNIHSFRLWTHKIPFFFILVHFIPIENKNEMDFILKQEKHEPFYQTQLIVKAKRLLVQHLEILRLS